MLVMPPKLKMKRECKQRKNAIINGLLNNYEKATSSGDNVSFDDCIEAPANIILKGKEIKQATETRNLFNNDWEQGDISHTNGLTIVNTSVIRTKNFIKVYPNHLYKILRTIATSYTGFRFYDKDYNYLGSQAVEGMVVTNTSDNSMSINQSEIEMTIINTQVAYMKVRDASNDLSTIYTMTTEAINTDYPSSIEYVEGNQNLQHLNANMLCVEDGIYRATNNVLLTVKNGIYNIEIPSTITANFGIRVDLKEPLKLFANEEYTLSSGRGTSYPYINLRGINNNTIIGLTYNDHGVKKFTLDEDKIVDYLYIYFSYENGSITFSPMLLKGNYDTAPDFIKNRSKTCQLSNIPPTYSENDKIVYLKTDDKNAVDGEGWYVYNTYTKMILNGLENWFLERINDFGIANFGLSNIPNYNRNNNTDGILTSFKKQTTVIAETKDSGFILNNEARLYIRVDTNVNPILTVDEFKLWLSENNQELVYKLLNPIYTKITDQILIKQLNELQKIFTYEGTNHFIVTSENGQPVMLEVTVYKNSIKIMQKQNEDMQKEIDNLKELVLNNVANS